MNKIKNNIYFKLNLKCFKFKYNTVDTNINRGQKAIENISTEFSNLKIIFKN